MQIQEKIINEINHVPPDKLTELYSLIHYYGDKRLTAEYSDILRTYENTGPGVSVISYR